MNSMAHLYFQVMQDLVAGENIGDTGDGLATFLDRAKELAVLQLYAV